jgi:hypothetical protein
MPLKLGDLEVEMVRKLVNGEAVSVSSQQRVRLELAGAIREGARGIVVTAEGRRLAGRQLTSASAPTSPVLDVKVVRDGRGRRLPFQRKSIF